MEEDLDCLVDCEEEDFSTPIIECPSSLSQSASLFRWEQIFGENMLIVHQEKKDWLVGVQVALLLNRETYNLYRSMKNKGINMERASIQQIDQLLAQGLVKPGTRSITLIPLDQARSFILEDQQRVEKRKQTKQTSKKPYEVMRTKLVQSTASLSSQWKQTPHTSQPHCLPNTTHTPAAHFHSPQVEALKTPKIPKQSPPPPLPPPSLPQQFSFGVQHKEKKGQICRPIAIHPSNNGSPFAHQNGTSLRSAFDFQNSQSNVNKMEKFYLNKPEETQLNHGFVSSNWNVIGRNPKAASWNMPLPQERCQSQLPPIEDMLPHLFSGKDEISQLNHQPQSFGVSPLKIPPMLPAPLDEEPFVKLKSPKQIWVKNGF